MKNSFNNAKFWIGILISIFFLWLSFRNVTWSSVWISFKNINFIYLLPSMALILFCDYFRAIRWKYLLLGVKKINIYQLFSIIMISQFLLQVLPARIGEIIRAYLIGKKYNISKTASFSSIIVERIFDGCFIMIVFSISLYVYPGDLNLSIPGSPTFSLKKVVVIFSAIYVFALCLLLLVKLFPITSEKCMSCLMYYFPVKIKDRAIRMLNDFIEGLSVFHDIRNLLYSMLTTCLAWVLAALSYYVSLVAFNIESPFYFSFILLGFIVIAVMIPSAPGFVGIFHFVVQLTLQKFFGVSPEVALSYAWVIWSCNMLITVLPGLYYFNQYNLHIKNIEQQSVQTAGTTS